MVKTATRTNAKRGAKKAVPPPARKAAPARKVLPARKPVAVAGKKSVAVAAKKADSARATAKHEAARGKLERVRVPPSRREDGNEGKYVYCVIRSDQPLSFGLIGLGPE